MSYPEMLKKYNIKILAALAGIGLLAVAAIITILGDLIINITGAEYTSSHFIQPSFALLNPFNWPILYSSLKSQSNITSLFPWMSLMILAIFLALLLIAARYFQFPYYDADKSFTVSSHHKNDRTRVGNHGKLLKVITFSFLAAISIKITITEPALTQEDSTFTKRFMLAGSFLPNYFVYLFGMMTGGGAEKQGYDRYSCSLTDALLLDRKALFRYLETARDDWNGLTSKLEYAACYETAAAILLSREKAGLSSPEERRRMFKVLYIAGMYSEGAEAAAAAGKDGSVLAGYYRGKFLLAAGNIKAAVKILTDVIEREPKFADAWYLRGRALQNLGMNEKALADYRTAVSLQNNHLDALKGISAIRNKEGGRQ